MADHNLNILQWNCQTITKKLPELKRFLQNSKNQPDIICLQETHLKKEITIPSYHIIHNNRYNSKGGGVLIAIKEGLQYSNIDTTQQDIIAVTLKLKDKYLDIVNLYLPPSQNIDTNIIEQYLNKDHHIIILGDFNSHNALWGSNQTNARGKLIENFIDKHNLTVLNTKQPTRLHHTGTTSNIDLTLTNPQVALNTTWEVANDNLGSDHYPIIINTKHKHTEDTDTQLKFNFKKANWNLFQTNCKRDLQSIQISDNPSQNYNTLLQIIHKNIAISVPQNKHKKSRITVPYWTDNCQKAINKRKAAAKLLRRYKNTPSMEIYKNAKAECKDIIQNEKTKYWQNYCSTLNQDTKLDSVWRMAKRIKGNNSTKVIPTLKDQNNKLYENNTEKANLIAQQIQATSNNSNTSKKFKNRKAKFETKWLNKEYHQPKNDYDSPFTHHELQNALRTRKNTSAPGEDNITYEVIKNLPQNCIEFLLNIYNKIWEIGEIIPQWKNSIIIPIHKPGNRTDQPTSYRPIALLSVFSKLMEKMITNRLTHYVEQNNLVNTEQTGFRKGKNTIDQLIRLHDSANKSIHTKGFTQAIFLDFSKAFDTLWVAGLLYKLRKLNISTRTYNWIKDYLANRTIQVKVSNTTSSKYQIKNGTPQGSIISPILFILMLTDFPKTTDQTLKTSLFADDSAIWKSGRNITYITKKLQVHINKIIKWTNNWGFVINPTKTYTIIFSKRKVPPNLDIFINKQHIQKVPSTKFLGLIFDNKLNWSNHIQYITEKCQPRINLLRSLTGTKWGANKTSLLHIYRALIRSIIDYGSELFYNTSTTILNKLDKIQHQCLRIITGALKTTPKDALLNECGEIPLKLRRKQILLKHLTKIHLQNSNPAKEVENDDWQSQYAKFDKHNQTYSQYIQELQFEHLNPNKIHNELKTNTILKYNIDTELTEVVNKHDENILITRQKVLQHIEKYTITTQIYTDGSKFESGSVGAAIFIKNINKELQYKLPTFASIYTAELYALLKTINWIIEDNETNPLNKYSIFTDSLSSVQLLKRKTHNTENQIIIDLFNNLKTLSDKNIILNIIWIPSHINITGNERADTLAKQIALSNKQSEDIPKSQSDYFSEIESNILKQWQSQYNNTKTAKFYKQIEPKVTTKIKFTDKNRKKEVLITRLKFGHCLLNKYKYNIGLTTDKYCENCNKEEETPKHVLFKCSDYPIFPSSVKLQEVFSHKKHTDTIYNYFKLLSRIDL